MKSMIKMMGAAAAHLMAKLTHPTGPESGISLSKVEHGETGMALHMGATEKVMDSGTIGMAKVVTTATTKAPDLGATGMAMAAPATTTTDLGTTARIIATMKDTAFKIADAARSFWSRTSPAPVPV